MSEHNETHAEAVAALRRWGTRHFARAAKVREFCDRIEAAHRREMSKIVSKNGDDFGQLGDTARLREALEKIKGLFRDIDLTIDCPENEAYAIAEKALAAPPRNCERFKTKEEAAIAFANEKKQWIPQQVLWELAPWLDWLFATAKEGVTDGSK